MKKILVFVLAAALSGGVLAEGRINAKESLRICKGAITSEVSENVEVKFRRKSATSVNIDRYRHWINFLEVNEDQQDAKKLLCETDREGKVLTMRIQFGKWRL